MENVRQIDKDVIKGILLVLSEGRSTVTYGELSKIIEGASGRRINPHMGFNVPLGRIQDYCIESDVPCLSALVVNQEQIPGSGFIEQYRKTNPFDKRSDQEILEDEQKSCLENQDWSHLLQLCDIAPDELWNKDMKPLNQNMLNWSALVPILDQYEDGLASQRDEETYKWKALKHFKDTWDIDAEDFHAMLCESLSKANNLLTSYKYYPKGMIEQFADNDPEGTRESFRKLFDNGSPLAQRMEVFSEEMEIQLKALNTINRENGAETANQHYQDAHAMSVYLSLNQDDEHYIYKARPYESFAARVGAKTPSNKFEKVNSFEALCTEILDYLLTRRKDLVRRSDDLLPEELRDADSSHHMLTQDIVFYASWGVARNWAYAPGEQAKYWPLFRSSGIMGIGWKDLGDPSRFSKKQELKEALIEAYKGENPKNDTDSIWSFVHDIKPGDVIWARRGTKHVVGCGIVKSEFKYESEREPYQSIRDVEWIDMDEFDVEGSFHQRTLYELTEKTSVKTSELDDLSQGALADDKDAWWPSNEEYSPGLTTVEWRELLEDESVFNDGSMIMLGCLRDFGGQATMTELAEAYGRTKNWYLSQATNLAKRIAEKVPSVRPYLDDENSKWWPILFVGKAQSSGAAGSYLWRIREELAEALNYVDWTGYALKENDEDGNPQRQSYWWLNANPKIWSFAETPVGEVQSYTLLNENGNKRRIYQNFLEAKPGDIIIGYESNPVKKIVALGEIVSGSDGEKITFKKTEALSSPIAYQDLKEMPELEQMEFFVNPNGSLFKVTRQEFEAIMDAIREQNVDPAAENQSLPAYDKKKFLEEVFIDEEDFELLKRTLARKKNLILQGAPGTGKTFAAERLAYAIIGSEDDSRTEFVQFHQSYSYEDFVMGYRPEGDGFQLSTGIFYDFCKKAESRPDKPFFFIIDEINRGNMSKILGELLMLIEANHRGKKVKLAYDKLPFSVPDNLYIIGMMNTADRSLSMIDYALRRRFAFYEMQPAFESEGFRKKQAEYGSEALDALVEEIKLLNEEIETDGSLGRGFRIGHSYFCELKNGTSEELSDIVDLEIIPTLEEYWFDNEAEVNKWRDRLRSALQ